MLFPYEIHRKFRSLNYLHFWKGTEFGSFLHYAGRIEKLAYENFKLLYCAITMLLSRAFKDQWEYASTLLKQFVEDYSVVYDRVHLVVTFIFCFMYTER